MVACQMTGLPPYIPSFSVAIPHLASWRMEKIQDSLVKGIILTIDSVSENSRHVVQTYAISDGSRRVKHASIETEIQEWSSDNDDGHNLEYDLFTRSMTAKVPRTISHSGVKHCERYEKGIDNVVRTVSMTGVDSSDIDCAFPDLKRVGS
jgi:hypothetical protein